MILNHDQPPNADCKSVLYKSRLRQFGAEAGDAGLKLAQYALRWLLDQLGITSVVMGVTRISETILITCVWLVFEVARSHAFRAATIFHSFGSPVKSLRQC